MLLFFLLWFNYIIWFPILTKETNSELDPTLHGVVHCFCKTSKNLKQENVNKWKLMSFNIQEHCEYFLARNFLQKRRMINYFISLFCDPSLVAVGPNWSLSLQTMLVSLTPLSWPRSKVHVLPLICNPSVHVYMLGYVHKKGADFLIHSIIQIHV